MPGESEGGGGGVCGGGGDDGCGEEQRGEEEEEEREGEETEEVRGEIWEQQYSQLESAGLGGSGEPDSMLEWNGEGECERRRIMAG